MKLVYRCSRERGFHAPLTDVPQVGVDSDTFSKRDGSQLRQELHLALAKYYELMDVLVSPSLTIPARKEQFGLVVAQAMSSEVPVLGSTCGETPNIIDDAGPNIPRPRY